MLAGFPMVLPARRWVQLVLGIASAWCGSGWTHRHEIVIADVADVAGSYGDQALCPTRSGDELDFDGVRGVDIDNGTQVTPLQSVLRLIGRQYDNIEGTEAHVFSPG